MSIERNLAISILKLTKEGPALIESVNKEARVPSTVGEELLEKMQSEELIYLENDCIEISDAGRLKLAIKAAALGADIEHISHLLCWQEFEKMAAVALESNRYTVKNNVHFKHESHRWEIDVVGCKKPLVVCVDCKHWQHSIAPSALRKIADAQLDRTKALADSMPNPGLKLQFSKWDRAKFVPALVSLMPSSFKFYYGVPVVPILQIQDFISQLPAYTETLRVFNRKMCGLTNDFKQSSLG